MANEKDLNRFFRNPPKGGNGAGVPTQNPMSPNPRPSIENRGGFYGGGGSSVKEKREERENAGLSEHEKMQRQMSKWNEPPPPPTGPAAQTSLRESFEAGEMSSRGRITGSARVQQGEMRNFQRGTLVPQEPGDPSGTNWFDHESTQSQNPAGDAPVQAKPEMVLNPDTNSSSGMRTDGKPEDAMPRSPRG